MKRVRSASEIFGLSFLDVICCGFGAMVLLVLLSKNNVVDDALTVERIKNLLSAIAVEQKNTLANETARARLSAQVGDLQTTIAALDAANQQSGGNDPALLQQRLVERRQQVDKLRAEAKQSAARLLAAAHQDGADQVIAVGGIPVDSEHLIFIIDTSGSMQAQWPRVIRELENVLAIHPQVKGFQIMNDHGAYLLSGYSRRWMRDTPGQRKRVLALLRGWREFSPSSPMEGLRKALKTYAKRTEKLAIYVFGDDHGKHSYDADLDTISQLNRDSKSGQPMARIHGIGFQRNNTPSEGFATLMREVARRNRGAFVAFGE